MSDALWPLGLQHARLPCPSPCPGVCSNIYPLSWWCHPTISSTVAPFSSCLQSFKAPRSFLVNWLLASCMATHSSTLAWKMPWTEEPGRLQSMGSQRVRHDRATSLYFSLSCIGEGNGNLLQCSCLENPGEGEPGGLPSMGSHRVGHDWSDLAAAAKVLKLQLQHQSFQWMLAFPFEYQFYFTFFFFEIIVDAHAIVRNDTDRSFRPFSQYPPVVGKCIVFLQNNIIIKKLTLIQPLNA